MSSSNVEDLLENQRQVVLKFQNSMLANDEISPGGLEAFAKGLEAAVKTFLELRSASLGRY